MFLIDTNILVAEVLKEYEQDHMTLSYLAFFKKLPLMKRVVPDSILNEFETMITQVVPSRYNLTAELTQNLKAITCKYLGEIVAEHTLITPTTAIVKDAFSIYQQNVQTHYISFTDSLVLALARQSNFTILSKDQRLNARAKELNISYYAPQQ
jgi:predicted nucleic acid-binding protein